MKRLDYGILRIGGLPLGRIVEVAGRPSAGKSSFAMNFVASAQKQGYSCAWVDVEGDSYTTAWAKGIGADVDNLTMLNVSGLTGDKIIDMIQALIVLSDPPINVIVLDSIANIRAEEQTAVTVSEQTMHTNMARAKLLTEFFQSLFGGFRVKGKDSTIYKLNEFPTCFIAINHLKDTFAGNYAKADSIGGDAGKFAACIRLFFERLGKDKEDPNLSRVKIHCEKNKLAPPFGNGEFLFNLEQCTFEEDFKFLLDSAVAKGLVTTTGGGRYTIGEEKFHGVEAFKERCLKDDEFYTKMVESAFGAIHDS